MAPMALTMGWGILLAIPITLVLMPCLLLIQDDGVRLLRWVRDWLKRKPVKYGANGEIE